MKGIFIVSVIFLLSISNVKADSNSNQETTKSDEIYNQLNTSELSDHIDKSTLIPLESNILFGNIFGDQEVMAPNNRRGGGGRGGGHHGGGGGFNRGGGGGHHRGGGGGFHRGGGGHHGGGGGHHGGGGGGGFHRGGGGHHGGGGGFHRGGGGHHGGGFHRGGYRSRPGWRHGWYWNRVSRPRWWRSGIHYPPYYYDREIPYGYYQCTAFDEDMNAYSAGGRTIDEAAYNALYVCSDGDPNSGICIIPEGYCRFR